MKKMNLTLWVSALLAVLMLGCIVSCGSDDADEEMKVEPPHDEEPAAAVPTNVIQALAMLQSYQWKVSMDDLKTWNDVQGIDDYESFQNEVDDALFCLMTDHCTLMVHIKAESSSATGSSDQWVQVKLFEYNETSYYNLEPDKHNPAEGFIYEDDTSQTLLYRHLTNRSMELLVGYGGSTVVLTLTNPL